MHQDTFIIHIVVLGILTVASAVASIVFFVIFNEDKEQFGGFTIKKKKWFFSGVLCALISIAGVVWWTASSGQPWREQISTLHEIKDVEWPDGTKTQMFTCDGISHDITSMFMKIVDKESWDVKRIRWSPMYLGVSWSCDDRFSKDQFYLQNKSSNKKIQL